MASLFETEDDVRAIQDAQARSGANAANPRMNYDPINDIRSQIRQNASYSRRSGGNLIGAGIDRSGLLGDSITLNPQMKRATDMRQIQSEAGQRFNPSTPEYFGFVASEMSNRGYHGEAMKAQEYGLAMEQKRATLGKTKKEASEAAVPKSIWGSLDPSKYTKESREVFTVSGDYADLEQYEKPSDGEKEDKYASIEYNKYLESLRVLDEKDNGNRYERALTAKRADKLIDTGRGYSVVSQADSTAVPVVDEDGKKVVKDVPLEDTPIYKANVKKAELEVKRIADLTAAAPKTKARISALNRQWASVSARIDQAKTKISPWTTGFGGLLAHFPQSEARSLRNDLDTIRANIGFDKLQNMRDNSETGGALGQVSEMENRLLQAVNGALDQLANGEDITDNLDIIQRDMLALQKYTNDAYITDYGKKDKVEKIEASEGVETKAKFDPKAKSTVIY